jgi:hypothetical protein
LVECNALKKPGENVGTRFAMPFDAKCTNPKCPHPSIGMGVRFNSRKSEVGKYLDSVIIYEFKMKCPNCDNEFIIRTDPKSTDY